MCICPRFWARDPGPDNWISPLKSHGSGSSDRSPRFFAFKSSPRFFSLYACCCPLVCLLPRGMALRSLSWLAVFTNTDALVRAPARDLLLDVFPTRIPHPCMPPPPTCQPARFQVGRRSRRQPFCGPHVPTVADPCTYVRSSLPGPPMPLPFRDRAEDFFGYLQDLRAAAVGGPRACRARTHRPGSGRRGTNGGLNPPPSPACPSRDWVRWWILSFSCCAVHEYIS